MPKTEARRILVVAAHPDDEILGCGATIARHHDEGDTIHVLILAEGATARDDARSTAGRQLEISALREAAKGACGILGALPPVFAGFPDNRMDTIPLLDVIKFVEREVFRIAPSIVYTHHAGDLNVDHRIAHAAVLTACRPIPDAQVEAIYGFETVSSSEWSSSDAFVARRFVNVTAQMERKRSALGCYRVEMRPFPHARSVENIEALARVRGASVGVEAAEAFDIIREIIQ